jgi:hypothetical protein
MTLSAWMMVALGAVAQLPATPVGEAGAAKKYEVDVSKTTTAVKAGAGGTFALMLKPAAGFKISAEAPLKIALASGGLKLAKSALATADARDAKSGAPAFEVKFEAPAAGPQKIDVNASFYVCNETLCEKKQETLAVAVNVAP